MTTVSLPRIFGEVYVNPFGIKTGCPAGLGVKLCLIGYCKSRYANFRGRQNINFLYNVSEWNYVFYIVI